MSADANTPHLDAALERAKERLRSRPDEPAFDLEPVMRAALAQAGLTWELVGHSLDTGTDPPVLRATFKLCHGASGEESVREFPIMLGTPEPTDTTVRNALSYLWAYSVREVLHTDIAPSPGPRNHLQPTLKIPKIPRE